MTITVKTITGSRRWTTEIDGIKAILADYDETAGLATTCERLRAAFLSTGIDKLEELAEEIEYVVETTDELDSVLEDLYDWADDEGVWIG